MRRLAALLVVLVALGAARRAWSHPAPHSLVLLDLRANDVNAELRLPIPELESALGRALVVTGNAFSASEREQLRALVSRDFSAASPNGSAWTVEVGSLGYAVDEQAPVAVVDATLTPPTGQSPRNFTLFNEVIGRQVQNHSAWVAVRSDFARGLVSGPPTMIGTTHYLRHRVMVDRAAGNATTGFLAVFRLGLRHIADGTDHLLFLLVLLLPAPVVLARARDLGPCWGREASTHAAITQLLRVVTAFTLGHSLTLLLATSAAVRLPGPLVETLIAVSILVSAVHAVRPLFPGREAWVAGSFGLIHGLAFAGALAELHLGAAHLALALLGFNLGIEAMQLAVVAATFPWLLLLARSRSYAPFRISGALLAGFAALAWIGQRAFNLKNPIDALVTALAARPTQLLCALAALTLAARIQGASAEERRSSG